MGPFTLYGLQGCPHCAQAETFLRARSIPTILVLANDDPVAIAGVKALTPEPGDKFPVLVSRITKEVKVGFVEEEYERLARTYFAIAGASASSVFGGGQPGGEVVSQQAAQVAPASRPDGVSSVSGDVASAGAGSGPSN